MIDSVVLDTRRAARSLRCAGSGILPPGACAGEEHDGHFVGWWFVAGSRSGLQTLVTALVAQLAPQPDPSSLRRLAHAQRALATALRGEDPIGALLAAADGCYWAAQAMRSGLLTAPEGVSEMAAAVLAGGQGPAATVLALWTRYQRRLRVGEDDAAERVDVILALCGEDALGATASVLASE